MAEMRNLRVTEDVTDKCNNPGAAGGRGGRVSLCSCDGNTKFFDSAQVVECFFQFRSSDFAFKESLHLIEDSDNAHGAFFAVGLQR